LNATRRDEMEVKTSLAKIEVDFLGALAFMDLEKKEKKEKGAGNAHRRKARRHVTKVEKWVKNGNVNCVDLLQLLQAEQMTLSKTATVDSVRRAFDTAIQSSTKSGFVHNAALANERAALYLLSSPGEDSADYGMMYMRRAVELYTEWGAMGKVRKLEWQHDLLGTQLAEGHQKVFSSSIQGRKRFSSKLLNLREKISFDDSFDCSSNEFTVQIDSS